MKSTSVRFAFLLASHVATSASALRGAKTTAHVNAKKRRTREQSSSRPAVADDRQHERIIAWKMEQQQEEKLQQKQRLPQHDRILMHSMSSLHNKKAEENSANVIHGTMESYGVVVVSINKGPDLLHAQTDEMSSMVNNGDISMVNKADANHFFPVWDAALTSGHCTDDDVQLDDVQLPAWYHPHDMPSYATDDDYLFETKRLCCRAWFRDASACIRDEDVGQVDGHLLKQGKEELVERGNAMRTDSEQFSGGGGTSNSAQFSGSNAGSNVVHYYYPTFNNAFPDGRCVNDGNEPASYAHEPHEFLFQSEEDCCKSWFIHKVKCMKATRATPNPTPLPTRTPNRGLTRSPTRFPTRNPTPSPTVK